MSTDRASPAFLSSVLLHGAAVALIVLLGWLASPSQRPAPKVFELVQGVGDNYMAKEAPKLGDENGSPDIKLNLPTPAPAPEAAPPAPMTPVPPVEPAVPVQPAPTPVEPVAPKSPPAAAKPAETVPNFTKTMTRAKNRKIIHERWLESVARAKAAKAARLAELRARQAAQKKNMSYDEYLKEHGMPSGVTRRGLRTGVAQGTGKEKGAGGTALTRAEMDELDAYFAELKIKLRQEFATPPDATDQMTAGVTFYMGADGSISHVRISRSSGNAAFDQAVLEAFHRVRMGPRPDHSGEEDELDFSLKEEAADQ